MFSIVLVSGVPSVDGLVAVVLTRDAVGTSLVDNVSPVCVNTDDVAVCVKILVDSVTSAEDLKVMVSVSVVRSDDELGVFSIVLVSVGSGVLSVDGLVAVVLTRDAVGTSLVDNVSPVCVNTDDVAVCVTILVDSVTSAEDPKVMVSVIAVRAEDTTDVSVLCLFVTSVVESTTLDSDVVCLVLVSVKMSSTVDVIWLERYVVVVRRSL